MFLTIMGLEPQKQILPSVIINMINATEADLAPYCLGDDILAIIISFLQPLDMLEILSVNKQWRVAANSAATRLIEDDKLSRLYYDAAKSSSTNPVLIYSKIYVGPSNPIRFNPPIGKGITFVNNTCNTVVTNTTCLTEASYKGAVVSEIVMSSGKHIMSTEIESLSGGWIGAGAYIYVGLVRPGVNTDSVDNNGNFVPYSVGGIRYPHLQKLSSNQGDIDCCLVHIAGKYNVISNWSTGERNRCDLPPGILPKSKVQLVFDADVGKLSLIARRDNPVLQKIDVTDFGVLHDGLQGSFRWIVYTSKTMYINHFMRGLSRGTQPRFYVKCSSF